MMTMSGLRRCWVPGLVLLLIMPIMSHGARVLLVPWIFKSHIDQFAIIGEDLVDHGHDVHIIVSTSIPFLAQIQTSRFKVITYDAVEPDIYSQHSLMKFFMTTPMDKIFRSQSTGFKETCSNPLRDQQLYKKLKDLTFDLAIVDAFPAGRCMLVLMHRLGLPYVNLMTTKEPWLLRKPALPSDTPFIFGENPYTTKMTFWQRLDNLWSVIDWAAFTGVAYIEDDFLKEYFYETTPVPINQLAGNALLWLLHQTPYLDYPEPSMPNEILIGGLTSKPAKPLPDDLELFMSSNANGAIIASFGSTGTRLPHFIFEELLAAFESVKYNVILQFPSDLKKEVPDHIKLLPWLPQNDLLGHKNTKLFITHCGTNGQMEGLYHGVPMVGLPIYADQLYNARRIVHHGFGLYREILKFKAEDLVPMISEVIENSTYTENIQAASAAFQDQPMKPREKALYWIEHVLKHGGRHLRSHALDMMWYEYLMLDIAAFIFGIFTVFVVVSCCIVKKVLSMLCGTKGKQKAE